MVSVIFHETSRKYPKCFAIVHEFSRKIAKHLAIFHESRFINSFSRWRHISQPNYYCFGRICRKFQF